MSTSDGSGGAAIHFGALPDTLVIGRRRKLVGGAALRRSNWRPASWPPPRMYWRQPELRTSSRAADAKLLDTSGRFSRSCA
jgi:hypothetical protein